MDAALPKRHHNVPSLGCLRTSYRKGHPWNTVTIIGVDLAKNVFQVHGASGNGAVAFRKKLTRQQFQRFVREIDPCLVAMEACSGAHYWARELALVGDEVHLITPRYVKLFLKRQKNDAADAEAIAEAAVRPTMDSAPLRGVAGSDRHHDIRCRPA